MMIKQNNNLSFLSLMVMLVVSCWLPANGFAQSMSIGIPNPDATAQLHLASTSKGLLIPRMTAVQRGQITGPAKGLLLYETTSNNIYYNEGTESLPQWRYLVAASNLPAVAGWRLLGNAGITSAEFIGTTDNNTLVLKANNEQVGIFSTNHASVRLGLQAGQFASGSGTIAIGRRALHTPQSVPNIVCIGDSALHSFEGGIIGGNAHTGDIVAIGAKAAQTGTFAYIETVAIGYRALAGNAGYNHTAVGNGALAKLAVSTVGAFGNTAVGRRALENLTGGMFNTAVGYLAGSNLTTGSNNSFLGYNANVPAGSGFITNASAIGANAEVSTDNTMAFGNDEVRFWVFGQKGPSNGGAAFQVNTTTVGGIKPYLSTTGTWTNTSDSTTKKDITAIQDATLWEQVKKLPVYQWQYKGDTAKHIGPMAQDFKKIMQLGDDEKAISTIDPAGVALATLQILIKKNTALKKRIEVLERTITKGK